MGSNIQIPKLEERGFDDLLQEFKALIPYYTPEWRPGDAESGADIGLVKIFLHLMGIIHSQFNRLPEKHFTAFLDKLGIKLLPDLPASVPVTFCLTQAAQNHVLIPEKTRIAAGDVIFETERNMLAVPARLLDFYHTDITQDAIFKSPDHIISGEQTDPGTKIISSLELFTGDNLQQHILYLGHPDAFNILNRVSIALFFSIDNEEMDFSILADDQTVQWQYYSETGWHDLGIDTFDPAQNQLTLLKDTGGEIMEYKVAGITSRWLRCKAHAGTITELQELDVNKIEATITALPETGQSGLLPDMVFYNDLATLPEDISADEPFFPFGPTPALYDTFYMGSHEVFSGKAPQIDITFTTDTDPSPAGQNAVLSWEYWDGQTWNVIKDVQDNTANLTVSGCVIFPCPPDITPFTVNGKKNLWLRVRLVAGDYGRIKVIEVETNTWQTVYDDIKPPKITGIELSYTPVPKSINHCLTYNNLQYINRDVILADSSRSFSPFQPLDEEPWSFYLSFSSKPEKGPVSIFFALQEQPAAPEQIPAVYWEYYNKDHTWVRLDILDNTMGLSRTGTIEFVFPPDFTPNVKFGNRHYWLRGRLVHQTGTGGSDRIIPCFSGIYLNTSWALQARSVNDETVGSGDGSAGQQFLLKHTPVISEEIWIDEIKTISTEEITALKEKNLYETREVAAKSGELKEFWVNWRPVETLLGSGKNDRHYEIARVPGEVLFGDGIHGKPAPTGKDNITVHYRSGGGKQGNVAAYEIKDLKTAVPFLDKVYNPISARGGADKESLEQLMQRGPRMLKHRNRAITTEDFEQLALMASGNVARVKCLANFNYLGENESGWATVIVIPHSENDRPLLSLQQKQQIESYLQERAGCVLVEPNRLQVWDPLYIGISVNVTLYAAAVDALPTIEKEANTRLRRFLHPLTGGRGSQGWPFGRLPCLSDFYALLENITGVDHVEISLENTEVSIPPHAVVCSGQHQIMVNING